VVPRYDGDLPPGCGGRQAERVGLALDDQHRNLDAVELVEPALLRPPRRVLGEGEAEDAGRARGRRGPARHAGARRPAAGDERKPGELLPPEVLDHREPRGVEMVRGRGGAAAGHRVGLLDERDREAKLARRAGDRLEVARRDPAPGAVAQHERRPRLPVARRVEVRAGGPVRRLDHLRRRRMRASQGRSTPGSPGSS
jgi:hypothetical protein